MTKHSFIIIGGGLSGLAAGIRLSQYGHHVTIFERHTVPGGLNSYYERAGRVIDTGLHALTNISTAENRNAPMNQLLRQLRIRRSELELCPQEHSAIEFPDHRLVFTNDIGVLREQITQQFPEDSAHFDAFVEEMKQFNPYVTDRCFMPTLSVLERRFVSPVLRDMLCCAVMYYGNAMARDMDYRQFCIIFRSIFLEGLGRPKQGMKHVIDLLCRRLSENAAKLELGVGIASIEHDGTRVTGVVDTHGERHEADGYLSCAGGPETGRLLSSPLPGLSDLSCGVMSFLENVFELQCPPAELKMVDGILFKHFQPQFVYEPVQEDARFDSIIVCVPANFPGVSSREVRVSLQGSSDYWNSLSQTDYQAAKSRHSEQVKHLMDELYPGFANAVVSSELYTPKTITRFTSRLNGAIYGMPDKCWNAMTPLENLKLIGADQGYLGIVGTLMSGVAVSNRLM